MVRLFGYIMTAIGGMFLLDAVTLLLRMSNTPGEDQLLLVRFGVEAVLTCFFVTLGFGCGKNQDGR